MALHGHRTLSYWHNLTKIAGKLQSRNNLLMKLAGSTSTWGANANTLRSSALALCYSVAEYCCPVWHHSAHVSLIDAQLHSSMRLISGTVRSTPLPWLPVLTNSATIELPALRCRAATDKLLTQAECHSEGPLYDDVFHPPLLRLKFRKPLWSVEGSRNNRCHKPVVWDDWQSAAVVNSSLAEDPTIRLPGFDLHRRQWSLLNRFRTGHGHCNASRKNGVSLTTNYVTVVKPKHYINSCPLTKFDGRLLRLHEADEAAVNWLTTFGS